MCYLWCTFKLGVPLVGARGSVPFTQSKRYGVPYGDRPSAKPGRDMPDTARPDDRARQDAAPLAN